MLAATPLTFQVVDDATANKSFRYSDVGAAQGSTSLVAANSAPRGVASSVAVEKTWVIDANRNVYVYNATSGSLLGSWTAGSMANNATPEGIAADGTDVWIVDSKSDKVFRYAGAASRLSGSQTAASSFSTWGSNTNPKDMVSDGYSLWIVDDGSKYDRVFQYTTTGVHLAAWDIDAANKAPTGIALDPANVGDLWISDSGKDRVYKYAAAASRDAGSQTAAASFPLASGNGNAQGLVVPGRLWAETPYNVQWVRQLGTAAFDMGRGVAADSSGNVYVTGLTKGELAASNPTGTDAPFFAKYDAVGSLQWVRQLPVEGGNVGGKVATDDLGNIFLTTNVVGAGPNALYNYDADGNVRWSTPYPVPQWGIGVVADNLGFAYVSSYELPTEGSVDEFEFINLRKYDALTGDVVWERSLHVGGSPNNTSTVSYDGLGNIYFAAYTSGSVIGPNAGGQDAVVAKYTIDGDFVWARQFGTAAHDNNFQVAADGLGNVFSAGGAYGSLGGPHAGTQDAFVAKHDAAGNLQWIRQLGTTGEETNAKIWADGLGNVFVATSSTGSLGGPNLGGEDIVLAKYDTGGNQLWRKQFGVSGNEIPSGGGITGDSFGNLYVTGRTSSSWGGPNAGGDDIVLIKLTSPAGASASSGLHVNNAALSVQNLNAVDGFAAAAAPTSSKTALNARSKDGVASSTVRTQSSQLLTALRQPRTLQSTIAEIALADFKTNDSGDGDDDLDEELILSLASARTTFPL